MEDPASEILCTRCVYAAGCTFPVDISEAIISCRRFEDIENSWHDVVREVDLPDPGRMEGLCGDCRNRTSCVFRKREGGTWHCEEYY